VRVLIDATYVRRGHSGTGVYVTRLTEALRAAGVDVVEAVNERRRPPGGGRIRSVGNAFEDARWTQVELPRRAREAGADVIHHPLPAFARRAPHPQVVTVHDLAFEVAPELFDRRFARFAASAHRRAALAADAVVCVSHATARDVAERWGREDVVVAPHGPGQALPAVPRRATPGWVLYVGDDEPRKNVALLRAGHARWRATAPGGAAGAGQAAALGEAAAPGSAAASPPLPLVIAGSAGSRVTPERLATLYAGALALVHPALHEGFGLTPLEAMAQGVPVVALRSAAVEEVCGDAATWFATADELAAALEQLRTDPEHRAALIAKGRERVKAFTWEASARAHVAAYERAIAHRGTRSPE